MFDLSSYETVAMLNRWFVENYPMGRTNIEIIHHDPEKGYITCRAEVYLDVDDAHPAATNIAHGFRDLYNSNMRRFYAEDIASSCLGRAITLLKGGQTATRDDMEKVQATPLKSVVSDDLWATLDVKTYESEGTATSIGATLALVQDQLGGEIVESAPSCSHGRMLYKEGRSEKTGNAYKGFTCPSKVRKDQCKAVWL
jgi:hypothetical protein